MAEQTEKTEKTTIRRKNYVGIVGYLKENTLECVKNKEGVDAIRGNLVIATSETEAFKVQFYCSRVYKNKKENLSYKDLLEVLPNKTMSIAAYLSGNPTANFQTAAQCATKLYVRGHMEEYASKLDNKERSIVTLRGDTAKLKTVTDARPFVPEATFAADMYIESIAEETQYDKDTENIDPTGRLLITGLLPDYKGIMNRITFIAPKGKIADFISNNYEAHDTANFTGKLVDIEERKETAAEISNDPFSWNGGSDVQFKTTFVRERQIMGRENGKLPIHEGEENCITTEEVKNGLVLRDQRIADNTARRNTGNGGRRVSSGMAAASVVAPAAPVVTASDDPFSSDFNDFNF